MATPKLNDRKVRYSRSERHVFEALPKNGKAISTVEIANKIYNGERARPLNARQSVLAASQSLMRKTLINKEPFKIERSVRQGPHPVRFWINSKSA